MQYADNPGIAIRATATIPQYALVTVAGALCGADATTNILGVAMESRVSGQLIPVRFLSAGSIPAIAAVNNIAVGDIVYKDANGTVGKTNTNAPVGIALEASAAVGDFISVKPF